MSLLGKQPEPSSVNWDKILMIGGLTLFSLVISRFSPTLGLIVALIGSIAIYKIDGNKATAKDKKEAREYEQKIKNESKWR